MLYNMKINVDNDIFHEFVFNVLLFFMFINVIDLFVLKEDEDKKCNNLFFGALLASVVLE